MRLITKDQICFDLVAKNQEEALKELAQVAYNFGNVDSADIFFKQLALREKESTTGFGNGIAIPHARHACVKNAGIIVGRFSNDLEWNAMDKKPVNVCICLIAPDDKDDLHLKMLSKLARKLIYEDFISILKESDKDVVLNTIQEVIN